MQNIFVNATALTSGGGLVTLKQFLDNIPLEHHFTYYIFCSIESLPNEYSQQNIKFVFPKFKTGFARIYWDMLGLKLWSKRNKINPDLIISLQNTATILFFDNIPQILYIMQSIPFVEKKWNIFNKNERILWFYKNIYPFFMGMNLKKNHYVVTQSSWIKKKFSDKFNFPLKKIYPIRPTLNLPNYTEEKVFKQNHHMIFCPSSSFVYKNNIEIVNALIFLKSIKIDISKLIIYITTYENDDLKLLQRIIDNNLKNNFIFLGRISYSSMLKYYNQCDLVVFPSYIETFGLPLLEAASFGKAILCANEDYAVEVIQEYDGAKLLNINSPKSWGIAMIDVLKKNKNYTKYKANFTDSWNDFFILIKVIVNKEIDV